MHFDENKIMHKNRIQSGQPETSQEVYSCHQRLFVAVVRTEDRSGHIFRTVSCVSLHFGIY